MVPSIPIAHLPIMQTLYKICPMGFNSVLPVGRQVFILMNKCVSVWSRVDTSGVWRSWGKWRWAEAPWHKVSSRCWTLTPAHCECQRPPKSHLPCDWRRSLRSGPLVYLWSTKEKDWRKCTFVMMVANSTVELTEWLINEYGVCTVWI